jgi:hypothetical protein
MDRSSIELEPLCTTSEKQKTLLSKKEIQQITIGIKKRIAETFDYLSNKEIACLLKTNTATVKSFTEDGELPTIEILLCIHKVTGVSIEWILTGKGEKYTDLTSQSLFSN